MPEIFREIAPCTLLAPVPAVLVGVKGKTTPPNLITIAWAGTVCSHPPMLSISVRKERYSYELIKETGEFTVNLVGKSLLKAMDYAGVKSGREVDKFSQLDLTPLHTAELAYAPGVAEAPAFLCCKVASVQELGSHDLFLANIVGVHVQDRFFSPDGAMHLERAELIGYNHGVYQTLTGVDGFFGFSLASREVYERRMQRIREE